MIPYVNKGNIIKFGARVFFLGLISIFGRDWNAIQSKSNMERMAKGFPVIVVLFDNTPWSKTRSEAMAPISETPTTNNSSEQPWKYDSHFEAIIIPISQIARDFS